ncbi:MAG: hypothetical protein SFT93_01570 [Rickettsiaceae bacterium]|nr:hypothetical protein [Rickettsiaceae bacterium]
MNTVVRTFFEFSSDAEEEIFLHFYPIIADFIEQDSILEDKLGDQADKLFTAKDAAKICISILVNRLSPAKLLALYERSIGTESLDITITEIIIDSIYDASKFKLAQNPADQTNLELFKHFVQYDQLIGLLYLFQDVAMSVIINSYNRMEFDNNDKQIGIIKEFIPFVVSNLEQLAILQDFQSPDYLIKYLVNKIKKFLSQTIDRGTREVISIFSIKEREMINKMDLFEINKYLVSINSRHSKIDEIKDIIKQANNLQYYLKEVVAIEDALSLLDEKLVSDADSFSSSIDRIDKTQKKILSKKFTFLMKIISNTYDAMDSSLEYTNHAIAIKICLLYKNTKAQSAISQVNWWALELASLDLITTVKKSDAVIYGAVKNLVSKIAEHNAASLDQFVKKTLDTIFQNASVDQIISLFNGALALNSDRIFYAIENSALRELSARSSLSNRFFSLFSDKSFGEECSKASEFVTIIKRKRYNRVLSRTKSDILDLTLVKSSYDQPSSSS